MPKITEVVVLAKLNCNHKCVYQSVAGKIGDNTIHTCTYIYNTHSQYLCTDHSHTQGHKLHTLTCNVACPQLVEILKELSCPHSLCQCRQTDTVFHMLWDGLCHYSLTCSMHMCVCVFVCVHSKVLCTCTTEYGHTCCVHDMTDCGLVL